MNGCLVFELDDRFSDDNDKIFILWKLMRFPLIFNYGSGLEMQR